MDRETVDSWVKGYVEAWNTNDPEDIARLFTDNASYFYKPFGPPWRGRGEIVEKWLEFRDEPGQTEFRYEVIAVEDDIGVVRGWTRYLDPPPRDYSNIWVVRLDAEGRCVEFTEFWIKHEEA